MHLKLSSCIIACALFSGSALAIAQQATSAWTFTFFAGDPPIWHTSDLTYPSKAECEIARAEKTGAGYPVGECSQQKTAKEETSKTPDTRQVTPTTPTSTPQEREVEKRRARKLLEGCQIGCDTTHQTCQANLTTIDQCVQDQNARCIERCTTIENLPHHQCINEVCLPTEVNLASWKGLCETQTTSANNQCAIELESCRTTCTRTHDLP